MKLWKLFFMGICFGSLIECMDYPVCIMDQPVSVPRYQVPAPVVDYFVGGGVKEKVVLVIAQSKDKAMDTVSKAEEK